MITFLSDKDFFLQKSTKLVKRFYPFFDRELFFNEEIIIGKSNLEDKIKNKKLLIVGAGPTASEREWNTKEYDFIFSCNHFFKFDKLKEVNVHLSSVSAEVDILSDDFINLIEKTNTIFLFESRVWAQKEWCGITLYPKLEKLYSKYPDRINVGLSRWEGKIGAVPRLIIFACMMNPKSIDIVGMDGYPKDSPYGTNPKHSFEQKKKMSGTYSYTIYEQQYKMFWNYILNDIGKNIKFKNLGHGHPYNITTNIVNLS